MLGWNIIWNISLHRKWKQHFKCSLIPEGLSFKGISLSCGISVRRRMGCYKIQWFLQRTHKRLTFHLFILFTQMILFFLFLWLRKSKKKQLRTPDLAAGTWSHCRAPCAASRRPRRSRTGKQCLSWAVRPGLPARWGRTRESGGFAVCSRGWLH